jgi:hypothetical protein
MSNIKKFSDLLCWFDLTYSPNPTLKQKIFMINELAKSLGLEIEIKNKSRAKKEKR